MKYIKPYKAEEVMEVMENRHRGIHEASAIFEKKRLKEAVKSHIDSEPLVEILEKIIEKVYR